MPARQKKEIKSVTCPKREVKKMKAQKKSKDDWLSGTSSYFNWTVAQKDISLLLTALPSCLMDVFTIAFGREQRHLRENPFGVIYHRVTTTGTDVLPLRFLSPTSLLFNHILLSAHKKPESALPRGRLCWLLKWCRGFLALSPRNEGPGQHSHTGQIYTGHSCHTCGDPFSDRVLHTSAISKSNPSGRAKCCHWYGLFPTARLSAGRIVGAEWRHDGL